MKFRLLKTMLFNALIFLSPLITKADQFTVNSSLDAGPGTLREAVSLSSSGDSILFDELTNNLPITLATGQIEINKSLSFFGNDSSNTIINGSNNGRIFLITGTEDVVIKGIRFTNGLVSDTSGGAILINNTNVTITDCAFNLNTAEESGGAIYMVNDQLTINNSLFNFNSALGEASSNGGGAIANMNGSVIIENSLFTNNIASGASGSGGAIINLTNGNLDITASIIKNNSSMRAGGGIEDNSGDLSTISLTNVMLDSNMTSSNPGNGGGLHISGAGNIEITGGTVNGNEAAAEGGGLWNGAGSMLIDGVMIMGNTASGAETDQGGGGIYNLSGMLTIQNETMIADNIADGASGSGGGILNDMEAGLSIMNTTIKNNSSMRAGGGIEDNSGTSTTISLTNVMLDSNMTSMNPGSGGGLHISGAGNIEITGGTVNGNTAAAEGGGLWNGAGSMLIDGVMIMGNTASGAETDQGGGGIYNLSGMLTIQNNTMITDNIADGTSGSGGGILNDMEAGLSVSSSTIKNNSSMRAGGGIEDNSGTSTTITLTNVMLDSNMTSMNPGNGGGLHITGAGNIEITGGTVNGNEAAAEGGGLWNGAGSMLIDGVMIMGNTASGAEADQGGGGIYNLSGMLTIQNEAMIADNIADGASGSGGGILNDMEAGLSIMNTTIKNNSSMRAGGGIEDNSGASTTISLTNVMLDSNMTSMNPGSGGGLHISGAGNIEITGGTVNGNTAAAEGGGLWNGAGSMLIDGVMIMGNTASGAETDQGGGGIYNLSGMLTIQNEAMIADNIADGASGSGGGILNDMEASLSVMNSTIKNNSSMRAGGGIEDNSGASTTISLTNVMLDSNMTSSNPGNGGGLHITGAGNIEITGGTVNGNTAAAEGGGLWNNAGSMLIDGVMIMGNTASGAEADQGGGGIYNLSGMLTIQNEAMIADNIADGASGSGGGILNDMEASLSVMNSTIKNNSSMRAGGGIEDNSGASTTITLTNVMLDSNMTSSNPGNGGGLHISGAGNIEITGGTVYDNEAEAEGGGLWNGSGNMTLENVTIDGNIASGNNQAQGGGGIYNNGGMLSIISSTISNNETDASLGTGAGIHNGADGMLTTMATTISGNTSLNIGGGIFNDGTATIETSTITNNGAENGGGLAQITSEDSISIRSTIVAGNMANAAGMDIYITDGKINSEGYNLIGQDNDNQLMEDANDMVGTESDPVDAMLDVLADNGGPTFTHALLCGSMAYNMGEPNDDSVDQRDSTVFGTQRDIGAFELQDDCDPTSVASTIETVSKESSIYPNPAKTGAVNITTSDQFSSETEVQVINLSSGEMVYNNQITENNNKLNLDQLDAGTYLVKLISNDLVESHKLVLTD